MEIGVGGLCSATGQFVWDLWRTKCHFDWFFSAYFSFLLSVCSGFLADEVSLGQVFVLVP